MKKKIESAIQNGLTYLEKKQNFDGSFVDFGSTGIASYEWITAHVCWILEDVPEFKESCLKGAQYLLSHRKEDGSWSFNDEISGDCGTTAQVIMLLKQLNLPIQSETIRWVLNQHRPDGGVCTYPFSNDAPVNNWAMPHTETALYFIGALEKLQIESERRQQTQIWVENELKKGPLRAFWWENPSYILWVQKKLKINQASSIATSLRILPEYLKTVPHLPFLLFGAATLEQEHLPSIQVLLDQQNSDGSWTCSPCLRVTTLSSDLSSEGGPLFAGEERIFSTAHAVTALFEILRS